MLDTHLVTHLVWEEKTGQRHTVRAMHGPNHQNEWAARVDHDVSRMAFVPFLLHDGGGRYRDIERISQQLRHPLAQRWGR